MFHCEAAETFCRGVIVVQSTASLLMFNDLFVFSHLLLWLLTACFIIQLTVIFHLSHTPTLHEKYNSYSLHHYKMSETLSKFCRSETQRYSMMQHREKKNILTVERLEQLYKYLNDQLSTWQSLTWLMDQSRWRTVTELFKTCCNFSLPTIFISKAGKQNLSKVFISVCPGPARHHAVTHRWVMTLSLNSADPHWWKL